jgi:hypothetical protein
MVDHNHPVDDTVINVWQANLSVAARETVDLDTVHVDFQLERGRPYGQALTHHVFLHGLRVLGLSPLEGKSCIRA